MWRKPIRTAVVIPVHNDVRYIGEAIQSVLAQTSPPDTFMVSDNASTDGTADAARELLGADGVSEVPHNVGMAGNFQRAVRLVEADLFAWLGSDDRLAPEFISATTRALSQQPQAQAAVTAIRFIDELGMQIRTEGMPCIAETNVRMRLRGYLGPSRWTEVYAMYQRDTLLRSPGFRDRYGPDVILMWWYVLRGPLAYVDEPLYEYREFTGKTTIDVVKRIDPTNVLKWRKENTDLWYDLLFEVWRPGVPLTTRFVATWELVRALDVTRWRARIDDDQPHRRRKLLIVLREGHRRLRSVRDRVRGKVGL